MFLGSVLGFIDGMNVLEVSRIVDSCVWTYSAVLFSGGFARLMTGRKRFYDPMRTVLFFISVMITIYHLRALFGPGDESFLLGLNSFSSILCVVAIWVARGYQGEPRIVLKEGSDAGA